MSRLFSNGAGFSRRHSSSRELIQIAFSVCVRTLSPLKGLGLFSHSTQHSGYASVLG